MTRVGVSAMSTRIGHAQPVSIICQPRILCQEKRDIAMTPSAVITIRVEPRYYRIIIAALRHADKCLDDPNSSHLATVELERSLLKISPILNTGMARAHINNLLKELEK